MGALSSKVSIRSSRSAFAAVSLVVAFAVSGSGPRAAFAQELAAGGRPLEQLTLEELLRTEVTSVSGLAVTQFAAPAAVYVLTGEEIRRSGLRTLPEALRLVPGMFVGRDAASSWTTGARGLTGLGITASRYLVMVDGRVVFDPLLSVALWDVVDVPVEQIDRIEVIRGPGATLWGVNALNGVISVITNDAHSTQGGRLNVGVGDETKVLANLRWGGETSQGTAYRVWGKYFEIPSFELVNGADAHDQWSALRGGVRVDGSLAAGGTWTAEVSAYDHPTHSISTREPIPGQHLQFHQVTTEDDLSGGFARFAAKRGDADHGWSFQGYFDTSKRDTTRIGYERDIADLDFRSWARWGKHQDLIWGVQADQTSDRIRPGSNFIFDPGSLDWWQLNAFVQNTSEIVPGKLFGMIGTKITDHEFVGVEVQPSGRLWWTPDDRQTLWAAISRPVRVPSRLEESGMIVVAYADPGLLAGGPPTGAIPFGIRGDDDLDVEKLTAYELGYRRRGTRWAVSTALFYNDYSTLIGLPAGAIGKFTDESSGETYGVEISATAQLTTRWRTELAWDWLQVEVDGPVAQFEDGGSPEQMAQIRSYLDLPHAIELDGALYFVDRVPARNTDDYLRFDLGVTWRPNPTWRFSLRGQNLLEPSHRESAAVEVPRNFYAAVELWF